MPIVNKQVKFLTAFPSSQMSRAKLALAICHGEEMYQTQYIGTCKRVYTKSYDLN